MSYGYMFVIARLQFEKELRASTYIIEQINLNRKMESAAHSLVDATAPSMRILEPLVTVSFIRCLAINKYFSSRL